MTIAPAIGAALASAGSSITGGIAGFLGNSILQDRQNKANVDLWREQTTYNNPTNTMTRLRDAGLNPAMALGSGTKANIAGAPPTMGRSEAPNVSTDIASSQQVVNADTIANTLKANLHTAEFNADTAEWDNSVLHRVYDKTGVPIRSVDNGDIVKGLEAATGVAEAADKMKQGVGPPDRPHAQSRMNMEEYLKGFN